MMFWRGDSVVVRGAPGPALEGIVTRVARSGEWADVRWFGPGGMVWSKRMKCALLVRVQSGSVKPLLDAVVGQRRDQWVDRLVVVKRPGDGWASMMVAKAAPAQNYPRS